MKCTECGSAMNKTVGDHLYKESGLDNVILHNTTTHTCPNCGAKRVQVTAMGQLHQAIASAIATKPARLTPPEVRFLRDHLDLTNKEFAELMGVSPEQASRWTNADPIGVTAERFLRVLATMGPGALAARKTENIKEAFVKLSDDVLEVLEKLIRTLAHMPSPSEPVRPVPINLRRGNVGWKPDTIVAARN